MIGTFLLVTGQMFRNRILQRLRRLKQPRYLIGAIAGAAYFYFMFFRRTQHSSRFFTTVGFADLRLSTISVVFLLMLIGVWALPGDTGGLEFSDAEIAFLFPAPLRRRDLLLYKILRSQPGALFSAVVFSLMGMRQGLFVGMWVAFSVLSVYFTMASLGRARLRLIGIGFLARLASVATILAALGWLLMRQMRLVSLAGKNGAASFRALTAPLQLQPFRSILFLPRFFATAVSPPSLLALATACAALISFGIVFFFIAARINVSFEEASIVKSQKRAARLERLHGSRSGSRVTFRRAPPLFRLRETGPPEIAVIWKNVIALMRTSVDWVVLFLAVFLFIIGAGLWIHERPAWMVLGFLFLTIAAMLPFIGPQAFANDLRLDMSRIELLKSYPLSGERLVAAEIAAPLVAISFFLMLFAVGGSVMLIISGSDNPAAIAGNPQFIITVMLLAVPVCAVQLLIRNAVSVLFPAWTMRTKDDQRGFVASGQRIVVMLANLIVLCVALLPAAVVFAPSLWLAYRFFAGNPAFVAVATMPAVGVIVAEVWIGVKLLGAQFETIDVSNELDVITA